jgi:hypothetical protein
VPVIFDDGNLFCMVADGRRGDGWIDAKKFRFRAVVCLTVGGSFVVIEETHRVAPQ